jgi:uncharacterized repeat protein (TIGR02543 family)
MMKQTINTANKIILVGLLAMALAFSMIGCGDTTDSAGDGECTVNFNLDGGNIDGNTASVQIQVKKGMTIDNLPTPQKANNTFGNWFTGPNGSGNEFRTTTVVTSNMTVFAKWTYSGNDGRTVTFDMDGGNVDGNTASITVTVQSGGTIANLPTPQKANNTFGGWYTEKNGGGNAFSASTQVTANITVYAKWTPSGNNANDPFAGTWEAAFPAPPPDVQRIVAANGSFSQYAVINGPPKKAHEFIRGTYTVSGNTVNVTMVSFNMKVFQDNYDDSKAEWVTWANLGSDWKTNFGGSPSYSITINNNSFTNGVMTFTKTSSGNSGNGPGGDGSLGNTLTITNAQVHTLKWNSDDYSYTYTPFNDTVTGLNYLMYPDQETNLASSKSLTDAINGTPSVTLTGGKLNVTLGTPKTSMLYSLDSMMAQYPGVTISPSGANVFFFQAFSDSAETNNAVIVEQRGGNNGIVIYYYADKAVNITGKVSITNNDEQPYTITMAMNLKAGWNSVIQSYTENDGAIMQTGKPSATDRWVVDEPGPSPGTSDPFAGTWTGTYDVYNFKYEAGNRTFTNYFNNSNTSKGTYTFSGNTVSIKITYGWQEDKWTLYEDMGPDFKNANPETSEFTVTGNAFIAPYGVTFTKQ